MKKKIKKLEVPQTSQLLQNQLFLHNDATYPTTKNSKRLSARHQTLTATKRGAHDYFNCKPHPLTWRAVIVAVKAIVPVASLKFEETHFVSMKSFANERSIRPKQKTWPRSDPRKKHAGQCRPKRTQQVSNVMLLISLCLVFLYSRQARKCSLLNLVNENNGTCNYSRKVLYEIFGFLFLLWQNQNQHKWKVTRPR